MPFIRKGLCKTDQIRCAKLIAAEVPLGAIAKDLRTTVDVIKRFTPVIMEKAETARKEREAEVIRHQKETQATAGALAAAAKEVLFSGPVAADPLANAKADGEDFV